MSTRPAFLGHEVIPRKVFLFWEGRETKLLQACKETLIRLNPNWKVTVMTSNDLSYKPPGFQKLRKAHKADWARVHTLSIEGGVWMDATCIHLRPLESWVALNSSSLQGFMVPFGCVLMENWAFATPPNFPLMCRWRDEFESAIRIGFRKYNKIHCTTPCLQWKLPYLTMHQCLDVVQDKSSMILHSSTSETGPFHLASTVKWKNRHLNILLSLINSKSQYWKMPFIKLTGSGKMLDAATIDQIALFAERLQ